MPATAPLLPPGALLLLLILLLFLLGEMELQKGPRRLFGHFLCFLLGEQIGEDEGDEAEVWRLVGRGGGGHGGGESSGGGEQPGGTGGLESCDWVW